MQAARLAVRTCRALPRLRREIGKAGSEKRQERGTGCWEHSAGAPNLRGLATTPADEGVSRAAFDTPRRELAAGADVPPDPRAYGVVIQASPGLSPLGPPPSPPSTPNDSAVSSSSLCWLSFPPSSSCLTSVPARMRGRAFVHVCGGRWWSARSFRTARGGLLYSAAQAFVFHWPDVRSLIRPGADGGTRDERSQGSQEPKTAQKVNGVTYRGLPCGQ
ncbi:unnamed protein product [Prorocentrum cordatum]|uniref:Uncharacterized protein n=1 Tax=Prorocentrum cordatum TaxID=2364126 RepID=A0ABN9RWA7_9DINO|nr:unnamed protein product [Polarella glacialis]